MSSSVPAPSDSLAIDFTAASQGARQFVSSRTSVVAYITAIRAVPVGPQPISSGGQQTTPFNPLQNLPDVEKGLRTAKWNADKVAEELDFLHRWAQGGIRGAVEMVLKPVVTMRDIFQTVPRGGTLTEKQSQDISTQMYMAKFMSGMLASSARGVQGRIGEFLEQLPNDHAVLANGPHAVANVRADIQREFTETGMKLLLNPVTAGIGNAIMEIGGQFLGHLDNLSGALGSALQGHEGMRGGIDAFTVGIQAVFDKYSAGEQALAGADAAGRTATIRRLNLTTAVDSLEQLKDFVLKSGF